MIKLARPLLRGCPMGAAAVCRTATLAVLIAILLGVWPALPQVDAGDLSLPTLEEPPSRPVLKQPSSSPERESRSAATNQQSGESTTTISEATAPRQSSGNAASRAAEAESRAAEDGETRSPARRLARADYSEEAAGIAPYDDTFYDDGYVGVCSAAECCPPRCALDNSCYPFLRDRLWVRGEYLLWWTRGSSLPPLVTTSTAGTDPNESGILGLSTTSILFGDGSVNTGANSGWRIALGYWLDDCQCTGIEVGYVGLGEEAARFSAASSTTPIIARPFYDTPYCTQSAMLAAHPDYLNGSVDVSLTSEFQAVEVLLRHNLFQQRGNGMDFLIGWRSARLDENLRISHFSEWTEAQGPIRVGTTKDLYDLFDAENQFNGAELGVVYREHAGRWTLEALMKLGLGCTHSRVHIDGMTTTTVPGAGSATFVGDLLAQETNIGRYSRDRFAVVPELGVTLSYAFSCRLRATFGYTFLYWSQVARPADQLDTNASQLPPETPTGSYQPAFDFIMSDYWAQGMNFGLEYCF